MENDILDSLEDVGYEGPMLEDEIFNTAIDEGARSVEFTKLVEWITSDLAGFTAIDDHVNGIKTPDDEENFLMELSGFLRELGCPYARLSEGPLTKRLEQRENRLHLLDYLLTELQAARMTAVNKPHLASQAMETNTTAESETATYLKQMLIVLGFPKPPDNITSFQLFSKVEAKIKGLIGNVQPAHLSKPLLKARLSDKQWEIVEYIGTALKQEYETRRDMMLKRLDVTIQSFKWSDRAKHKDDEISAVYQPIRRNMSSNVKTDMSHLLAAREDMLSIQKTSSGDSREKTKCPINRVMIGRVPDRGGRAYEHDVPPPEMPSFQKRQAAPQQQRQQSGDGRRVQGGWGGDSRRQQGGSSWGSNQQQQHYGGGQNQGNPAAAFFGGGQQQGYQQQQNMSFSGDQFSQMGYQGGGGGYQGGGGGYQSGGGGYQGGGGGYHGGGGRGGRGRGRGRGRGGRSR